MFVYSFVATQTEVKMFGDILWIRSKISYSSFDNTDGDFVIEPLDLIGEIMINFFI